MQKKKAQICSYYSLEVLLLIKLFQMKWNLKSHYKRDRSPRVIINIYIIESYIYINIGRIYRDTVFIAPQNLLAKMFNAGITKKCTRKYQRKEKESVSQTPTKVYNVYFALADQMVSVCWISC